MTQDGVDCAAKSLGRGWFGFKITPAGRTVVCREVMGEGLPCAVGSVTRLWDVLGFCKIPPITYPPAGSG